MEQRGRRISLTHYYERNPPNTKRVSRPSRWGNPFKIGEEMSREESIKLYKSWLREKLDEDPEFLKPLEGYNLACYCKLEEDCHVDVLLDLV